MTVGELKVKLDGYDQELPVSVRLSRSDLAVGLPDNELTIPCCIDTIMRCILVIGGKKD